MGWHKTNQQKFVKLNVWLTVFLVLVGVTVFSGVLFIAQAQDIKETEATPFYKCVIDNLNSEEINQKSNRKYSYKITDKELAKLETINCISSNSSSIDTSLLQKMANVKEASLGGDTYLLDFSSNPKLEKI